MSPRESAWGVWDLCVCDNLLFEAPRWWIVTFVEAFWVHSGGEGTILRHFRQVDFWQIVRGSGVFRRVRGVGVFQSSATDD